jgi:hypothetical protein
MRLRELNALLVLIVRRCLLKESRPALHHKHVEHVQSCAESNGAKGVPNPGTIANPHQGLGITVVPRRTLVICKVRFQGCRVDDLNSLFGQRRLFEEVVLEGHSEEEWSCRDHDSDVRDDVPPGFRDIVVELDARECLGEGGVTR